MNAVICPDLRRAQYEATEMLRRQGGTLRAGGRFEHPNGNVTLFMTYGMAQHRLRGLRLEHVRFVDPWRVASLALVDQVREEARACQR